VVEEFEQNPSFPCVDSSHNCVPDDYSIAGFTAGTCQSATCQGKQKPGFEDGIDEDPSNEATIRVTICHRTCSATNPWVRITIDDDAWGGPAASGCGHQLQHNVTIDCNVPAKEAQSGMTADEIWGVGRRVDYLIVRHGTREQVRINNGWDAAVCNNGGNCKFDSGEKDYWFYWERACPYVRHGACCGSYETGACCGDNPYPNESTEIKLKKYACKASATCSGTYSGVPADCEDDTLTVSPGTNTKYCYTVENTGDWEICDLEMSDPISPGYDPTVMPAGCISANSGPFWVVDQLDNGSNPPENSSEEETATVVGVPVLPGALPVTDSDPAGIVKVAATPSPVEELVTPAPASPRPTRPPVTPAPTPCPLMDNTGSTVCPGPDSIVSVLEEKGPTPPGGGDFLWDISFGPDGNEVTFKVDNPFDDDADVYVEYHKSVSTLLGAYDVDCERDLKLPGCNPQAESITAACIERGNKKFTIVTVYFVTADDFYSAVASTTTVPECCEYYDNGDASWKIVSYTYEILCTC